MSDQTNPTDPTERYETPEGEPEVTPPLQDPNDNLALDSSDEDETWMDRHSGHLLLLLSAVLLFAAAFGVGFMKGKSFLDEGVEQPVAGATQYVTVQPSPAEPEVVTETVKVEVEVPGPTEIVTVEADPVEPEVVTETVQVEVPTVPQACGDSLDKAVEVMDLSGQERDLAVEAAQALNDSDSEAYQDKVDEMEKVSEDRADARDDYDKLASDCKAA